jgi:hypothetical protein
VVVGRANEMPTLANSEDFESLREELECLREEVKSLRVLLTLQASRLRQLRGAVAVANSQSPEQTNPERGMASLPEVL